ncbi:MAG TPA: hypothetical protein VKM55_20515 [Candidatus Lokiarchaeia archaeon]|nr:hypothetical protein [Candidatus Lokiarchaeia archaeon]
MSKARKEQRMPERLRLKRQDLSLPKLFDMIALVSLLGSLASVGLCVFWLEILKHPALPRSFFSIAIFCVITLGTSFAVGRYMMDRGESTYVQYFRNWLAAEIVVIVLIIMSLGLPF